MKECSGGDKILFRSKHKGCKNDCESVNPRKRYLVLNESFKNVIICIISIGPSVAFWPISNFPNFCQNKNSLELLNIIFENSSPKGSLGANKKKIRIFASVAGFSKVTDNRS